MKELNKLINEISSELNKLKLKVERIKKTQDQRVLLSLIKNW